MKGAERRKLNKNAGFSLVELLIAVVILAIIVIPLLNLFLSSHKLNIRSRQTLRATTVAQDIMEGLKAYDIEELKEQFNNPADGFYVIDDKLIKGTVAEETAREVDPSGNPAPGLYYFSMSKLNMQGSEYDALIMVDARGYMDGSYKKHDNILNSAKMADARSIDKHNGTFVEEDKIRKAMLGSVWKDPAMKDALALTGATEQDIKDMADKVTFKELDRFFHDVSRTIEVELNTSTETDEEGNPMVDMSVTESYEFIGRDSSGNPLIGSDGFPVMVHTVGDVDVNVLVDHMPCGVVRGDEANVNIFYYPLYGNPDSFDDEIIVKNNTGAKLNLLIAKQRYEGANPGTPDPDDQELLTDAQLMAAEMRYKVDVHILNAHGTPMNNDDFTLKTNLGMNLAGKAFVTGEGKEVDCPSQLAVNNFEMDLNHTSQMNIFTLDGVRSPMGAEGADGEITELIYDVEIGVYKEGAAGKDFPDEDCMVVIEGSKNN